MRVVVLVALCSIAGCKAQPVAVPAPVDRGPVADHAIILPLQLPTREQTAGGLYIRGLSVKETAPDEAATLFRQVLKMTTADNELHEKARGQLEKMKR